jgi:hypothetical protein
VSHEKGQENERKIVLGFQEKGNTVLKRSTWLISDGDWAWPNSG